MRITLDQIKDEFAQLTKDYGELCEKLYEAKRALRDEQERLNWAIRHGYSPTIPEDLALEPRLKRWRAAIDAARKGQHAAKG